jgi:UDP-N-acetylmuramoyl-L-alanyl-D-glutamate--2,6-diaminopimelate ligase
MRLGELLNGCDYTPSLNLPSRGGGQGWEDLNISGVDYDSRKVKKGCLFVAIKGERYDGHDFIEDAIKNGSVAIVHEKVNPPSIKKGRSGINNPSLIFIQVKNTRKALACISHNFCGMPSDSLTLIGITGTNGKTTTTYLLKSILESWGKEVGLIGTIQYLIKDRIYPAPYTTPESLEFHGLLKDMLLSGCTYVVSEVSSHALAQYRVDSTIFNTAVFTNITRDHLDFHKTMDNYFKAKERLFKELLDKDGTAVINVDDPYGKRLVSLLINGKPSQMILTYGLEPGADIIASEIDNSFRGLRFRVSFQGKDYYLSSRLIGIPNVYNILSAVGASISLLVPWQVILEGIEKAGNVKGRFEKVDMGQEFLCIIDYAHTEDALERLIYTAKELIKKSEVSSTPSLTLSPLAPCSSKTYCTGREGGQGWGEDSESQTMNSSSRIITVFGCGGDRDRGKRPCMGAVATRLSDTVIITSDNPRSEDPADIIKEIVSGAVRNNYLIEPDRRGAIKKAVDMAGDGDIVLIAGKGHEDYQEIKGVRSPFSDRDILEEVIKDKLKVQSSK